MTASHLTTIREQAARAGINLFGLVDAGRFDRCQPKERRIANTAPWCGTVLVLGTAGRGIEQASTCLPACTHGGEEHARAAVQATVLASRAVGPCTVVLAGPGSTLNFAQLGEAAGFGAVSPVSGLFLHPVYGPWLRLRAALLFAGHPFGPIPEASIADWFHPCCGCERPCVSACPADAIDGTGGHKVAQCTQHRVAGGCADACGSRSACPLGSDHRDVPSRPLHGHESGVPRRGWRVSAWLQRVVLVVRGRPPHCGP